MSFTFGVQVIQHARQQAVQLFPLAIRNFGKRPLGRGIAAGDHALVDLESWRGQFQAQRAPVIGIRHALQIAKLLKLVEQPRHGPGTVGKDARQFARRHRTIFAQFFQRQKLAEVEPHAGFTQGLLDPKHDFTPDLADESAQTEGGVNGGGRGLHAADNIA